MFAPNTLFTTSLTVAVDGNKLYPRPRVPVTTGTAAAPAIAPTCAAAAPVCATAATVCATDAVTPAAVTAPATPAAATAGSAPTTVRAPDATADAA